MEAELSGGFEAKQVCGPTRITRAVVSIAEIGGPYLGKT
jgi:hypothetical protein